MGRLVVAALLVLAAPSLAAAQGAATRSLQHEHDVARALAARPAGPQRDAAVGHVLSDLIDYDALARSALGAHWETRTESERAAYLEALRGWVVRTYGPRVARVAEFRVAFEREEPGAEPVVHVTARSIASPRAEPWEIACRVHRVGDAWRVIDIVAQEVSLVGRLSREVEHALAPDGVGWEALVAQIAARAPVAD